VDVRDVDRQDPQRDRKHTDSPDFVLVLPVPDERSGHDTGHSTLSITSRSGPSLFTTHVLCVLVGVDDDDAVVDFLAPDESRIRDGFLSLVGHRLLLHFRPRLFIFHSTFVLRFQMSTVVKAHLYHGYLHPWGPGLFVLPHQQEQRFF